LTLNGLLYEFTPLLTNKEYFVFEMHESNIAPFNSSTFYFVSPEEVNKNHHFRNFKKIKEITEVTNVININQDFIAEDFYIIEETNDNEINMLFNKLTYLFSLVSIFDNSRLIEGDQLELSLNGYKSINRLINFNKLIITRYEAEEIFKVYKWIYNQGNLTDKIGLARNIISLHVARTESNKDNPLKIENNLFVSIQSNYDIYLKKNIEQYISVKNQVSEYLIDLSIRSSELVRTFSNAIKNNNFIFLSFFITVIVFNSLSANKSENIFTEDISNISMGILFISFLFMIMNIILIKIEINRHQKQFNKIKSLYDDILQPAELDEIFRKENLDEDINYVLRKIELFSVFWFLEIIILAVIISIS